jgi:hypothetical protein
MKLPAIIFAATLAFVMMVIAEAITLHQLTADLRSVCEAEEVAWIKK